ncbi:MAG: hypothetical protein KatS3mg104_1446 [Phycisphaerae bacterium]|nr:MAG: hypothetical protein KatS3mg104_1446 [Phycisphaerae bacterium]
MKPDSSRDEPTSGDVILKAVPTDVGRDMIDRMRQNYLGLIIRHDMEFCFFTHPFGRIAYGLVIPSVSVELLTVFFRAIPYCQRRPSREGLFFRSVSNRQ